VKPLVRRPAASRLARDGGRAGWPAARKTPRAAKALTEAAGGRPPVSHTKPQEAPPPRTAAPGTPPKNLAHTGPHAAVSQAPGDTGAAGRAFKEEPTCQTRRARSYTVRSQDGAAAPRRAAQGKGAVKPCRNELPTGERPPTGQLWLGEVRVAPLPAEELARRRRELVRLLMQMDESRQRHAPRRDDHAP
jgi:hypothetical protein